MGRVAETAVIMSVILCLATANERPLAGPMQDYIICQAKI